MTARDRDWRADVEALADEVRTWPHADGSGWPVRAHEVHEEIEARLRAILAKYPATPTEALSAFYMRVVDKDPTGYNHVRWDRATPVVVHASDRAEAFEKCWALMGEAPRYRTWTATIDRIEAVR